MELAARGHKITIVEQNPDILQGTSARTPGCMGLGYHYFDLNTAKYYMRQTIAFMKKYSDCFLGGDAEESHLRDGRYFIVKDSLISLQELMSTYDAVSHTFEEMCDADLSNKIFGKRHLHRTLHPSEFEGDVNAEKIAFAIQTQECLLNWKKFDERLRTDMVGFHNIHIISNFKVKDIKNIDDGRFCLISQNNDRESADYVINCTWQNIEFLNEKLGIKNTPDKPTTSRLKLLAEVEIPEMLHQKHSMFFCVGPHAMFSNLGNGIGRITYAPVTNFGTTQQSKMPEIFERWLSEGLDENEVKNYGQKIIDGVATYIPSMAHAKLRNVFPGIVKSKGEVDIFDKNSAFHKRDYDGVVERQIGWIENAAMKLFYCLGNAKRTAEILEKQRLAKEDIREIVHLIVASAEVKKAQKKNSQNIESMFFSHLQKNLAAGDFANENIVTQVE